MNPIDVTPGPVLGVLEVIPGLAPIARTNNKAICLRQFAYGELRSEDI